MPSNSDDFPAAFEVPPRLGMLLRKLGGRRGGARPAENLLRLVADLRRELREYEDQVVHAAHDEADMSWRDIAKALDEKPSTVHRRFVVAAEDRRR